MESDLAPPDNATSQAAAAARGGAVKLLRAAESLLAEHRYADAAALLAETPLPVFAVPDVALRLLFCEGRAHLHLGRLERAEAVLLRARELAESPSYGELERCEAIYRLGCCRLKRGDRANALALLTLAVDLAERAGPEADTLRSGALEWRSRCYQLQRDWDAARSDAEHAFELAEATGDARLGAAAAMQCSLVAERRGETLLARYYAERGRALAAQAGDRQTEARLLNHLGGLSCLLGETTLAVRLLKEAFALALDIGADADAAQAVASLARVHLRSGSPELAEEQARYALTILADRDDQPDEIGSALLVLGRALLAQGDALRALEEFRSAEAVLARLGSASHLAAAWVALGDAHRAVGDPDAAADLYRKAAETLQDLRL